MINSKRKNNEAEVHSPSRTHFVEFGDNRYVRLAQLIEVISASNEGGLLVCMVLIAGIVDKSLIFLVLIK